VSSAKIIYAAVRGLTFLLLMVILCIMPTHKLDDPNFQLTLSLIALNTLARLNTPESNIDSCDMFGVVISVINNETEKNEDYIIKFKSSDDGQYNISEFENNRGLPTGAIVLFYSNKEDAIVQAALTGEEFIDDDEI